MIYKYLYYEALQCLLQYLYVFFPDLVVFHVIFLVNLHYVQLLVIAFSPILKRNENINELIGLYLLYALLNNAFT